MTTMVLECMGHCVPDDLFGGSKEEHYHQCGGRVIEGEERGEYKQFDYRGKQRGVGCGAIWSHKADDVVDSRAAHSCPRCGRKLDDFHPVPEGAMRARNTRTFRKRLVAAKGVRTSEHPEGCAGLFPVPQDNHHDDRDAVHEDHARRRCRR